MEQQLRNMQTEMDQQIRSAQDMKELDAIRVRYLGKKGELTALLKQMGRLSAEEKPVIGKLVNETRAEFETALEERRTALKEAGNRERLEKERLDITISKEEFPLGHRNPLQQTMEELEELFISMGFRVEEGPEVESVANNFDKLNSPPDHPSRDLSDTFYFTEDTVLRTHTSPVQVRVMESQKPPIRMVCTGRTFRFDDVDDTHSPMFHQIEGMVIDKNISMGNLIDTLNVFVKRLLGEDTKTRFRPHYFPFTEPSAEVDVSCPKCGGEGCPACNHTGWSMELLGCGMVHPNVLRMCGIDPEVYSGFAFGMGIDRITMVKHGIPNIRLLYENDQRFLDQF